MVDIVVSPSSLNMTQPHTTFTFSPFFFFIYCIFFCIKLLQHKVSGCKRMNFVIRSIMQKEGLFPIGLSNLELNCKIFKVFRVTSKLKLDRIAPLASTSMHKSILLFQPHFKMTYLLNKVCDFKVVFNSDCTICVCPFSREAGIYPFWESQGYTFLD